MRTLRTTTPMRDACRMACRVSRLRASPLAVAALALLSACSHLSRKTTNMSAGSIAPAHSEDVARAVGKTGGARIDLLVASSLHHGGDTVHVRIVYNEDVAFGFNA